MVALADVVAVLETFYPPELALQWDAVGLVVGRPEQTVERVALAVDPVRSAVDQALDWGADLLIAHHPLLLRPVHSVAATTFKGAIVDDLIRSGCALFTAHTNADCAIGGVADVFAEVIGLTKLRPLVPASSSVDGKQAGLGRLGELIYPITLTALAERVAAALPATAHGLRIAGDGQTLVRTVALLPGAGDSLFEEVRQAGVDVYITADLRHHPASEAREAAQFNANNRPFLIDLPHAASEWHWLADCAERLTNTLAVDGTKLETLVIETVADPWSAQIA
ncbi:MAG: Nif3-like dinuclear metal center hexameric protein [Bifidobacteriaceae bacterium]|jgi:dinuclear metal center YbgI/SA1388 family protein|nr:Nif3-like dinuclear metal center hexameric protein [Bifidobacteriaceae bacterium]